MVRIITLCLAAVVAAVTLVRPAPAAAQAAACTPGGGLVAGSTVESTLVSGGIERLYRVYVPGSYDGVQPLPLVMSLHGLGGNARLQEQHTGFNDLAEREGFIAVYPQATGDRSTWRSEARGRAGQVDDVQFLSDLLAELKATYCVDPARVYVDGVSNGGGMTVTLACALGDELSAIGTVAAVTHTSACAPDEPVPLIAFHGTADEVVPYEGGRLFAAAEAWTADWAASNGCTASDPKPQEGDVSAVHYTDCAENADVIFYTIHGGGHAWPGVSPLLDGRFGETTQDINATEAMWAFFAEHARV